MMMALGNISQETWDKLAEYIPHLGTEHQTVIWEQFSEWERGKWSGTLLFIYQIFMPAAGEPR